MNNKTCFLYLLLVLVIACAGCSGGGSSSGSTVFRPEDSSLETPPEEALASMLQSWKDGGGPEVLLSCDIQAQVATGTATSTPSLGRIRFKDLSGQEWAFQIIKVNRRSAGTAEIKAKYAFNRIQDGEILITFYMIKIEGEWILDNIVVEQLPWVLVSGRAIQGYVRDSLTGAPISGALVYLSGTSYQSATDAAGVYSFKDIPAGTYTIVVVRDGYVLKTIPGVLVS